MEQSDVYAARLGRRAKETKTNMNGKSTGLYLVGGIAGLLSGILMIVSGYLVMFHLKETFIGSAEQQLGFIAHHPLSGIVHGLSVVSLILIVPMIVALLALLGTTAPIRGFLGIGFAALWIFVEIVGHLSQTAPLRALGELYTNPSTNEMALSIYQVSQEFWEALSMTAASFLCSDVFMLRLRVGNKTNSLFGIRASNRSYCLSDRPSVSQRWDSTSCRCTWIGIHPPLRRADSDLQNQRRIDLSGCSIVLITDLSETGCFFGNSVTQL